MLRASGALSIVSGESLAHVWLTRKIVFCGKALASMKNDARRVETVAVCRVRRDRIELRAEIGHVAQKRRRRNRDRVTGIRRRSAPPPPPNWGATPVALIIRRRAFIDAGERVRPADDDGVVDAFETHDTRGRHVRLARRRPESA